MKLCATVLRFVVKASFVIALSGSLALPVLSELEPKWEQLRTEGIAAYQHGEYTRSQEALSTALRLAEASIRKPELASIWSELSATDEALGRYREAERLSRLALEEHQNVFGPASIQVAISLNNLGTVLWEEGRAAEAEPVIRRAIQIWQQPEVPKGVELIKALSNLASVCRVKGRRAEAKALYDQALAVSKQTLLPLPR